MSKKNLTWNELEAEIFTQEEIAESRARVDIISAIIDGHISPSIDTINKLLAPLGKRLAVVDA